MTTNDNIAGLPEFAAVQSLQADLQKQVEEAPDTLPETTDPKAPVLAPPWPITNEVQAEAWGQEWRRCDDMEEQVKATAKAWLAKIEQRRRQLAFLVGGRALKVGDKLKVQLGSVEQWAADNLVPRCKYAQTVTTRFQFRAAKSSLYIPEEREEDLLAWIAENKMHHLRRVRVEVDREALKKHLEDGGEVPVIHTKHGDIQLCEYYKAGRYDEFYVQPAGANPHKD